MNIIYFNENQKDEWDDFVAENAEDGGLLQSWGWGDFQKKLNKKIWRIGIIDGDNNLLAACFAFKDDLSLGQKTIEIYRGPLINLKLENKEFKLILEKLLEELEIIAKKEKAMIIRIDFGKFVEAGPLQCRGRTSTDLRELGLRRANRDIQPRSTFFIDLSIPEKEILQKMKSKHRYNIRLSEKKGVKIYLSPKENLKKDFLKFWELIQVTSKRDGFAIHDKNYYYDLLNSGNKIKLYLANFEDKVIAASLVGCFGGVCTYMHGASNDEYKSVMAPYLLQWQAILDAKSEEKKY